MAAPGQLVRAQAVSSSMDLLMFGQPERPLFGAWHAPTGEAKNTAVLICPPWGVVHLNSYRIMLSLAERLASAGYHSLRFDYAGSGNSPGGPEQMAVSDWLDDIRTAAEEVLALGSADRLIVCGLRLGALLAANAGLKNAHQLVLWEPPPDGLVYVNELRRASIARWEFKNRYRSRKRRFVIDIDSNLFGYLVPQDWCSSISTLNYNALDAPPVVCAEQTKALEGLDAGARHVALPEGSSQSLFRRGIYGSPALLDVMVKAVTDTAGSSG